MKIGEMLWREEDYKAALPRGITPSRLSKADAARLAARREELKKRIEQTETDAGIVSAPTNRR